VDAPLRLRALPDPRNRLKMSGDLTFGRTLTL
jgi:hypothetical protein